MSSLDEKRKTAVNTKAEVKDAIVIANYGDPGLDEDYHFDILSRYVIVMFESCDRILTADKWFQMLAVVKRPENLWIKTEGGQASSPTVQNRSDALGNVNTGLSASFSVNGIPRINNPYAMGERIKVKKLSGVSTTSTEPSFFQSDFQVWDSTNFNYNSWHSSGATFPYINNDPNKVAALQQKTIQPFADGSWFFNFLLNKFQYEAFILNLNISDTNKTSVLTSIFNGTWTTGTKVYSANGGYLFQGVGDILISGCEYEDINIDNKARVPGNSCLPLVVASPNTFPSPKVRSVGTIVYNPSYSPVAIG